MDEQAITLTRCSTLVHTYGWTGHNKIFNTGNHVRMNRS